jgi:hypothetical protein
VATNDLPFLKKELEKLLVNEQYSKILDALADGRKKKGND